VLRTGHRVPRDTPTGIPPETRDLQPLHPYWTQQHTDDQGRPP
jgi:hypothetical protein